MISAGAAGVMVIGVVATAVAHQGPLTHDHFLAYLQSIVAAGVLGYGVQLRRARMSSLKEQAVQLAVEQADRTRLAVEQEHERIARELHDSVAHNAA